MFNGKIVVISLICIGAVLFFWAMISRTFFKVPCRNFNEAKILVNGKDPLDVAVARTNSDKARGLSGCESIPKGKGMMFIFSDLEQSAFWMKDMLVPIDIVWIKDKVVVGVVNDVLPPVSDQADLMFYRPPGLINAVLEVAAGEADRLEIREGTLIQLEGK